MPDMLCAIAEYRLTRYEHMIRKPALLFSSILFLMILSSCSVLAEIRQKPSEDMLPAARKILAMKFESEGREKRGFPPYFYPHEIPWDFRLGEPVAFYTLHVDKVYYSDDHSEFIEALEFRAWEIPIYLGSIETEPRTYLIVKKGEDGEWRFAGMGGDPKPIRKAEKKWPTEKGYRHSTVYFNSTNISLIMLEKGGELQFWYPGDSEHVGETVFELPKNEDGFWPAFSRDHLVNIIKKRKVKMQRYFNPDIR